MPDARLPLQIFEPRYLAMTEDAMSGDRMIGMIQPRRHEEIADGDHPEVFETGCAGKISSFSETGDGRYLISLNGICRFRIVKELPLLRGYRRVQADYAPFAVDLGTREEGPVDRERLLAVLRRYFEQRQLDADWESIEETSDAGLVTALSMLCPLAPTEKQALLETATLGERAELLVALLEMGVAGAGIEVGSKH